MNEAYKALGVSENVLAFSETILSDLKDRFAAIDAIALLESGLKELCHATVAVIAPPEVRVRRIMAREGISEDYAWARVRAQKSDDYFIKGCDYTLWNDCAGPEEFGARVRALLEKLFADKEV